MKKEKGIRKLDKLRNKIMQYRGEITKLRTAMMDDAEIAIISYGTVSRAAMLAVARSRVAAADDVRVDWLTADAADVPLDDGSVDGQGGS